MTNQFVAGLFLLTICLIGPSCVVDGDTSQTPGPESATQERAQAVEVLNGLNAELTFNDQDKLIQIDISERDFEESSLPDFKVFTDLQDFHAIYCKLKGDCLKPLSKCENLRTLDLFATEITDESLMNFKGHEKLESVNLGGTLVTDNSIPTILSWKKLRILEIGDTKISNEGLEKLYQSLPDVEVFPYPGKD